ncbi:MAG: hypothetical protein ACTSXY_06825 [Promethearchaeota archaeon]
MSKVELLKRLQKTEQKGVFKDPESGALIIKTPERDKLVDDAVHKKIPQMEKRLQGLDEKLDTILNLLQKK